jgi:hypothetical protein
VRHVQARRGFGGRLVRVEVLPEHPDVMLADAERERRSSAAEQLARFESLRME